ncbi:hypothetical protein HHI36_017826, partial [Cryptolaemus montrouzieri]
NANQLPNFELAFNKQRRGENKSDAPSVLVPGIFGSSSGGAATLRCVKEAGDGGRLAQCSGKEISG